MGFRYRRRFKIAPGVSWNLTGNSWCSSITLGFGKNVHVNIPVQRKGPSTMAVGNFGGVLTGLSHYSHLEGFPVGQGQQQPQALPQPQLPAPPLAKERAEALAEKREQMKADQERRWNELMDKQGRKGRRR